MKLRERISEGCMNWTYAVIIFAMLGGFDDTSEVFAVGIGVTALVAMFVRVYLDTAHLDDDEEAR